MKAKNNFDHVAFAYDTLADIVFGKEIRAAQTFFLEDLRCAHSILIPGGGTGWIAGEVLKVNPDCHIYYVEASASMISRARKYLLQFGERVTFIHGTEVDIPERAMVDVVITNFFLDLFPDVELPKVISRIAGHLKTGGIWLVTDFRHTQNVWQELLLWLMYRFFRITTNIHANVLPDWQKALNDYSFERNKTREFYAGFIRSAVYRISE